MAKYDTVDQSFEAMAEKFHPSFTDGVVYSFLFDIEGWGKRCLLINGNRCEFHEITNPDVIFTVKESDYLEIVNGEVSLAIAFMTGALSITGSVEIAEQLARFFPAPKESNEEEHGVFVLGTRGE